MAKLHACCFVVASLLTFVLPTSCKPPSSPSTFSFELHLQLPVQPLNLHNNNNNSISSTQPLTPYLFSDQPLLHFDKHSQAKIVVGSAGGLYLADPAAPTELRNILFTATLLRYHAGQIVSEEAENENEGALVMMGSLASGAVAVVGGTRDFAFARGQAKVSMAPKDSHHLIIFFHVELLYEPKEAHHPKIPMDLF